MSLSNINTDLLELEKSLSALSISYPQSARNAATARINYELDYANALDSITHEAVVAEKKLTVADKESQATIRTEETMRKYRESEAELDGAKKQIDILQSILMSTQSRVKLEMIERGLTNFQT